MHQETPSLMQHLQLTQSAQTRLTEQVTKSVHDLTTVQHNMQQQMVAMMSQNIPKLDNAHTSISHHQTPHVDTHINMATYTPLVTRGSHDSVQCYRQNCPEKPQQKADIRGTRHIGSMQRCQ